MFKVPFRLVNNCLNKVMSNIVEVVGQHHWRRHDCNITVSHSATPSITDGCPGPSNDRSLDWLIQFLIPELRSFSQHVKDAVNTGVVTGRAMREINQVLHTYITAHTIYLTSEQYTIVCKKLVAKYPNLMDANGKTKYVSIVFVYY